MAQEYDWYGRPYLNASYHPRDFRDAMARNIDLEGEECPYVPSGYYCPDYSVLSDDAFEYYLWWRTNARNGEVLKADEGYIWLFMTELVNVGDPETNLDIMIDVIDGVRNTLLSTDLLNLPRDYALSRGLSPGRIPRGRPYSQSGHAFLWDLTRYPIVMPDLRFLAGRVPDKWLLPLSRESRPLVGPIMAYSLAGIDELVRSKHGCGLLRRMGVRTVSTDEGRIRRYADWSGLPQREFTAIDSDDRAFTKLLDGIARIALRFMRIQGAKAPPRPRWFPEEFERIVAAAVDATMAGDGWDVGSFRVGTGGFWEDDDVMLGPAPRIPGVVEQRNPPTDAPPLSREEIEAHWAEDPEPGAPYVPSGRLRASYATMGPEQLSFYLSWRSGARKGLYSDVDKGYLWLYSSELLEMSEDPRRTQRELDRALRAYDPEIADGRVPGRDCEYLLVASAGNALLNGLDPEPVAMSRVPPEVAASLVLRREPTGRVGPVMAEVLVPGAGLGDPDPEGLYERTYTVALRAADRGIQRKEGRRLIDLAGRRRRVSVPLFKGLWSKLSAVKVVEVADVRGSQGLVDLLEGTLKVAAMILRRREGKPQPRVPSGFPTDLKVMIESDVVGFLEGLEEEARRDRARAEAEAMVLDPSAVESATADLEAVRDMMAVEEEPEPEPGKPVVHLKEEADPWGLFADMLDEVERRHLASCLEGHPASGLSGTRRRSGEVESSINAKAMDSVGDAVMEDGKVFEEYRDDIRRVTG